MVKLRFLTPENFQILPNSLQIDQRFSTGGTRTPKGKREDLKGTQKKR